MKKGIIVILIVGIILSISTVGAYLYTASNVTYSNSNLSASNTQKAIEELYDKACPSNAICEWKKSWNNVAVGDYVQMTPNPSTLDSSDRYKIETTETGYNSDQYVYPKQLNLWRVIKVYQDGTIEMVSEYVSSTDLHFKGAIGYAKYVKILNTVASQYENSTYTTGSRHIGFVRKNGQTEEITNTAAFDGTKTDPVYTWQCPTGQSCNPVESEGGGDNLYTSDIDLLTSARVSLKAKKCYNIACTDIGAETSYYLASREYYYKNENNFSFSGYIIGTDGIVYSSTIHKYENSWVSYYASGGAIRPIVTLKSGLSVSDAPGTKNNPFILP